MNIAGLPFETTLR